MITLLYYISYLLSAPFFLASWLLYALSWLLQFCGDTVLEYTTRPLWRLRTRRQWRRDCRRRLLELDDLIAIRRAKYHQ